MTDMVPRAELDAMREARDMHGANSAYLMRQVEALKRERNALKSRIDYLLNEHLCEMKPDYDDSIAGFNEAWDIIRAVLADTCARETL
jgi:hypothetical protein